MKLAELIKERRQVRENKKLIEEFPFLLPRNRWSGQVDPNYDYTYTELDAMPYGWRKAFGLEMCKEIKEELIKCSYLNDYRITDIKEKYGSLRWYDNGYPASSKIAEIIYKYEMMSENVCINCGKAAKYVTKGYIEFVCEDCKKYLIENNHYTEGSFTEIEE